MFEDCLVIILEQADEEFECAYNVILVVVECLVSFEKIGGGNDSSGTDVLGSVQFDDEVIKFL